MAATLILYGCFASHGREYDFDVLAPGDKAIGRKIRSARLIAPSWFAGRFDGRTFFGTRDLVGKYLGSEHPIARDRARSLEFILAYVQTGNAALPAWSEILALEARVAGDLRSAADLAMASSKPVAREITCHAPRFAGPRGRGDAPGWDGLVAQLSRGKAGAIISDRLGAARLVRWEQDERGTRSRSIEASDEASDREGGRGFSLRGAGLGILIAALGAAAALATCSNSHGDAGDASSPGDQRQ